MPAAAAAQAVSLAVQLAIVSAAASAVCSSMGGPICPGLSLRDPAAANIPSAAVPNAPPLGRKMSGAFTVSGSYVVAVEMRRQRALVLQPRAWITQPIGGSKVGFLLAMDGSGDLVGSSASGDCSLIVLVRQSRGASPDADPKTSRWSGHHQCGGVPIRVIALLRGLPPHFVSGAAAPAAVNGAAGVAGTALEGTIHYSLQRILRTSRALLALPTLALEPRTKHVARATARASRAVAWPWRAATVARNAHWVVALSLFRGREYTAGHAPHAEHRLPLVWHDVVFLSASPPKSRLWRHVLRARLYAAPPSRCSEFLLAPDPANWSAGVETLAAKRVMRWRGVYYCRGASHDVELAVRSRSADATVPHRTAVRERDVYVSLTARRTAWATARGGARCASACVLQDDGEAYCSAAAQQGGGAGGAMLRCGEHEALRALN